MQLLEIVFTLATLILLVISSFYGKSRKPLKISFLIGTGFLVLHFVFEIIRWQMIFIYLIFIILSLLLLKRSIAHLVFRCIGFFFGLLFIFTSAPLSNSILTIAVLSSNAAFTKFSLLFFFFQKRGIFGSI